MADIPATSPPADESSAQLKARLRRERRLQKINAGGASRLQAISNLQGGSHRDVEKDLPGKTTPSASPVSAPAATAASGTATPDPDEVDISTHHYTPASQPRLPSPFAFNGDSVAPFPPSGASSDPNQDPMMAMLQQMLSGASGPGAAGPPGDMPPGLTNLLGAMQGGSPEPSPDQSSAWIWRLVHSLFSLALATYIVFRTPFTGSILARTPQYTEDSDWTADSSPVDTFKNFFYMFATFEVAMQSSRYFIERGQLQGSGMLSSIAQFLPEPYGGYVRVLGRYSVIYQTVLSDAMVVVFVLGAASWWRGGMAV